MAIGPTIVLLGPAGATPRFLAPVALAIRALDAGATVLVPGLPGRLGVKGPALDSVAESARWLERELASGGVERALVVGHSYGGAIALAMALGRGAVHVAGLILVSTGAWLPVHPAVMGLVRGRALGSARTGEPGGVQDVLLDAVAEVVDGIARGSDEIEGDTIVADWVATSRFDVRGRVGELDVPVAILVGERDLLTPPSYGRDLVERIGGATLDVVAHAGHLLPAEDPERVARAVVELRDRVVGLPHG